MAEKFSDETREVLQRAQNELADLDPEILELDIDDPDAALAITLMAAMLKGDEVTLTSTDDDGRTETFSFTPLGPASTGKPQTVLSISSSDGTLSPEAADFAVDLLKPWLDAETDRMNTEG